MSANDDDADEAQTSAFMRALQRVVAIKPRELRSIAWSWLYFFSLLASTFVLRPLRDSMGLNGGADKYPWLFTGTLVAMVVVSPPFALLVTKLPRKRFIPIVYRVSIACLLAFWLALKFLPESFNLAAAYTFFIWFSVFNLFVVSVFRGFMADIWRLDQAKGLFGFIGVGGTLEPEAHFTDLGGDSLSALTFANLLHDIFEVDVPVGVIVSPASDLASIAAYIDAQRAGGSKRPTYDAVHGRDATEVHASDLTLDKFLDAATLAAAPSLPGPRSEVRTVLLTGATGFLGRYLALEWLERMDMVDGKVIALVRAKDDDAARQRLDATFDSGDPKLLEHYRSLAANHLEVLAGDKGEANLGLAQETWQRLADTVDLIVDPAALVNHVLPYSQLFGPNAVGTAELIRIALTTRVKPFVYVSTIGVGDGIEPGRFVEDADIRQISATRKVGDNYANGYGNSKWAGEVLLREAHDLAGLPVSVFRCDMIMADTTYAGQLNVPDMFTRMMLSLVATGVAPFSFYELDAAGNRQRAHFDGLPVEFIADAISTLGANVVEGFETYHVMNPYDDGISMDTYVDWLVEAGYAIARVPEYASWLARFETTLRALPENQRQASLLPLLHNYQQPQHPINGSLAPADRFRAAVQDAKIGPDKDIPHITAPVIVKYITDLELLGLL